MLHPSYQDLLDSISETVDPEDEDIVESRYSVVIATAKRTRELVDGAEPLVDGMNGRKALSTAVEEIYEKKIKIVAASSDETAADEDSYITDDRQIIVNSYEDEVEEEAEETDYEENGDYFEDAEDPEDEEEIVGDYDGDD